MKEIFEYEGADREDFEEAIETLGEEKFMALSLLSSAKVIEETANDLLDEAEEAKKRAKEMLKEEVDY